jgi:hypothetical protein
MKGRTGCIDPERDLRSAKKFMERQHLKNPKTNASNGLGPSRNEDHDKVHYEIGYLTSYQVPITCSGLKIGPIVIFYRDPQNIEPTFKKIEDLTGQTGSVY